MKKTTNNLNQDTTILINKILAELSHNERDLFDSLSDHEKRVVLEILKEIRDKGHSDTLQAIWEIDYHTKPVSPEVFLTDKYYLGIHAEQIWDRWKEELVYVMNPSNNISEWIITGAIGIGKTTMACICICYKTYLLSCMRDPQAFYGLMSGDAIAFGFFNTILSNADFIDYEKMMSIYKESRYFRDITKVISKPTKSGAYRSTDEEIILPHNIHIIAGSKVIHALGSHLYGGLLDEANFHKGTSISEYGKAFDIYVEVKSRMESRFMTHGGRVPGILVLASAPRGMTDFLEKHIERSSGIRTTHVTRFALYDVKPIPYCGKKFKVMLGDRYNSARILKDDEVIPEGARIIEVPIEHKSAFELSIDDAIRNIAGLATQSSTPLITRRELLYECAKLNPRSHPFISDTVVLDYRDPTIGIESYFKSSELVEKTPSGYRPKVNPQTPRYIHVDIGLTGDRAGMAMGHLYGYRDVVRATNEGFTVAVKAPVIYVDFVLGIDPPIGGQIDLGKIRFFIAYLSKLGFPIKIISYDLGHAMSADSIQILKKQGFDARSLSVDKDDVAYGFLEQAIREIRLDLYRYENGKNLLFDELINLERDITKRKVDHPIGGSKDISDALAGVCYWVMTDAAVEPIKVSDVLIPPKVKTYDTDPSWIIGDYKDIKKVTKIGDLESDILIPIRD